MSTPTGRNRERRNEGENTEKQRKERVGKEPKQRRTVTAQMMKQTRDKVENENLLGAVAGAAREIPSEQHGNVGEAEWGLGGDLLAPHLGEDRTCEVFGGMCGFAQMRELEQMTRVGESVTEGFIRK